MADREMLRIIDRAQNEVSRTRILRVVEAVYPEWILQAVLLAALERSGFDTHLNELDFNAHYLVEKGLLRLERIQGEKDKETWRAQLTAKGIDFLEGRLEEIGLASPDLVD